MKKYKIQNRIPKISHACVTLRSASRVIMIRKKLHDPDSKQYTHFINYLCGFFE
jgi:hypothetical protein